MLLALLFVAALLLLLALAAWRLMWRKVKRKAVSKALPLLHQLPVYWLENLITDEENAHLRTAAQDKLKRSCVQGDRIVPERTSSSAILTDDDVTLRIKQRLAELCNYPVHKFEPLQVVHYKPGQEYKPHHDYLGGWQHGKRHVTFFVYLNGEPELEGGETHFPELHLRVKPKRNCALLWYNVHEDGTEDPRTLHAGLPPTKGEKWGLNVWVRS